MALPSYGLAPASSPTRLPEFRSSSGAYDLDASVLPHLPFGGELPDVQVEAMSASSVRASDVGLAFDGGYYWVGDYLNIDGWVTNDTAADVGPILVHFVVQTTGGFTVKDEIGAAAVYNLRPGERATFKAIYELPAEAGNVMTVGVETLAAQPTMYPSAVNLTFVDQSCVADADGVRLWTFTYRNDTALTLENPLLGGWEYDASDAAFSTLIGAKQTPILPGATVVIEAYGLNVAETPASVQTYCQAVPAPERRLDPIYRFFNPSTGTHFYTVSAEERDRVLSLWSHVYAYEGIAYFTNPASNSQPLYRFYYQRGGSHFYTASLEEANLILSRWPHIFTYEGPAYRVSATQVPNSITVYRFVNRKNSSHFYTASAEEAEMVRSRWSSVYIYEGPAFWVAQ